MRKVLVLGAVILASLACGGTGSTASNSPAVSPPVIVVDVVGKAVKGQTEDVLTNTSAMTLYYLSSDTATAVKCSGQCATFWPPLLLTSGDPGAGATLPKQLTTSTTTNGRQVEYDGHPLYLFSKDKTSTDTKGEGITAFGGTWHVATPQMSM